MSKLIMLVGIPASGKSTYSNELANQGCIVHSSDALRKELFGTEDFQLDNERLFNELHRRIREDLLKGKIVVYDACNLSWKRRYAFLESLRSIDCVKECIVMATPYEQCLEQNSKRKRRVPEDVIKRMYMNFNFPAYFEGWNEIHIKYPANFDVPVLSANTLMNFNQDNHNHTLTLGNHLWSCGQYLQTHSNNQDLIDAGFLHDIGKPFCKTFINTRGETTEDAHYYNHQNTGAFLAMFYGVTEISEKDRIEICSYIQWHMQPYFNNTEKSKKKYRRIWGEEFYSAIMLLHEADENAH